MKRKLLSQLIKWKDNPRRKPLMLEGARQVGKTYLLRDEFGKRYFDQVLYVNMQNPDDRIRELFSGNIQPERIIAGLKLIYETDIDPDRTLIFFDEIQEVPRAITALKYFYEEAPQYHVVVAGSLLGVFLPKGTSFPVGKVDFMRLEPMDFEEFLWANGRDQLAAMVASGDQAELMRETLIDLLRNYMVVGGMPEAVKSWVEQGSIELVNQVQRSILAGYENDFSKHTDGNLSTRIMQVFRGLPEQFARNNNKFIYGVIRSGARAEEYELAIEWLINAGVVRRIYNVTRGDKLPLRAYADLKSFKLYFVDVGLFRQLAGIPSAALMSVDTMFSEFNGLLTEQYVLQQLAGHELFYWTSDATAEVDFVMQDNNKVRIVPIEVKSGANVHAKSLQVYRGKYNPDLAVRFSLKGLHYGDGLLDVPLYCSPGFDALPKKY